MCHCSCKTAAPAQPTPVLLVFSWVCGEPNQELIQVKTNPNFLYFFLKYKSHSQTQFTLGLTQRRRYKDKCWITPFIINAICCQLEAHRKLQSQTPKASMLRLLVSAQHLPPSSQKTRTQLKEQTTPQRSWQAALVL